MHIIFAKVLKGTPGIADLMSVVGGGGGIFSEFDIVFSAHYLV